MFRPAAGDKLKTPPFESNQLNGTTTEWRGKTYIIQRNQWMKSKDFRVPKERFSGFYFLRFTRVIFP